MSVNFLYLSLKLFVVLPFFRGVEGVSFKRGKRSKGVISSHLLESLRRFFFQGVQIWPVAGAGDGGSLCLSSSFGDPLAEVSVVYLWKVLRPSDRYTRLPHREE